ncbi:uncharacterized membrane protein (DUF485 family) [Bacillus fengqiuensis]|nr:uncharacterized membrane protein (DUF485 family) [Bacillus fengqiuensis]
MSLQGTQAQADQQPQDIDYTKIAQSAPFKALLAEKRKFIMPLSLFFLAFYFTLPILTAYSTVLNQPAFLGMTWAWVFAFAQFVMTWALCMIYSSKAAKFDVLVEDIMQQIKNGR